MITQQTFSQAASDNPGECGTIKDEKVGTGAKICREEAIGFCCEGEILHGVLALPEQAADLGVVIVVGGPQTRVGSHRQFVLLARGLAAAGYSTLRFDYRGMGDSGGTQRRFDVVTPDIAAAIDALLAACPGVTRVALWGLCDAASAALLYLDDTHDSRIAGLCLLNPWVRSRTSLAKTQVKHYYGQRLLEKEFWLKLLSGRLNIGLAVADLWSKIGQASARVDAEAVPGFQDRMVRGLTNFTGKVLLILSGEDYTAKEFLEYTAASEAWRGLLGRSGLTRYDVAGADHTFSSRHWRETVENATVHWLIHHE